jgi:hypothetical protein
MQFLKKHYEKILLGVVLAGLIGVLVFMLFYIQADKQAMDDAARDIINNPSAKPLPDLDPAARDAAVTRLQSPFAIDFETGNKTFNPFEWVKTQDNNLLVRKDTKTGPQMAVVTNITPLYLVLTLDSVMTNELGARYVIGVEKQAAATPAKRHKQQHYVSPGEKPNDTFALLEVKGPPENPDALVLKILDTGETASVAYGKPFRRVDGYLADLRYDPEKKVFHGRRAGDKISFGGTDYVFVDIKPDGLTLSDQSNGKKTPLPFAP